MLSSCQKMIEYLSIGLSEDTESSEHGLGSTCVASSRPEGVPRSARLAGVSWGSG